LPHNRYTKAARKKQRAQIARQEKELAAIERRLRNQGAEPSELPPIDKEKERRSSRIEQKRQHKAKRRGNTDENQK
jgi:hypothetical protein